MRKASRLFALICFSAPVIAVAQLPVTEVQLHADPADARVRPLESLVIQLRAYGEVADDVAGETKRVRLQRNAAAFELKDSRGGWLSKLFRFPRPRGRGLPPRTRPGPGGCLTGTRSGPIRSPRRRSYSRPASERGDMPSKRPGWKHSIDRDRDCGQRAEPQTCRAHNLSR